MKMRTLALSLAVALPLFATPWAIAQHEHEHAPAVTTPSESSERFATDAALRQGMSRIHKALDALRHYEMGHMPESIAKQQVDDIGSAIDYLFANCKLDAQADSALHAMLVPLLDGVQAFKKNPEDTSSVAAMRQAVTDYPQRFDDPDWPPVPESDSGHAH
ncbi:MAG: DnrO protein [Dokdonella sp.]